VTAALPQPGDVLAGKYRVERVLGVGGMGIVVCAHHLQLDERVALKFLRPEALENSEAVGRFVREARAAVKIKSEHVARIIDVGQMDTGSPYIVMEYLEGGDLQARLAQLGPLPIEQAAEFVLQACEAIAEAHALGIVHRDLKPANLFCVLRADGLLAVKVLDFGISKLTGLSASNRDMGMTRTQSMMGSPYYMSPEQMQSSKGVDARTDIWALGVILFELLTGRIPFEGEAIPELVLNIVNGPTPSLRAFRPDAPPALEAVVTRCLAKAREWRYGNIAELAVALSPFAPARSSASVERITRVIQNAGLSAGVPPGMSPQTMPVQALAPPPAPAATVATWGQTAPGTSGRTKAFAGLFAALALVSACALLLLWKRGTPHPVTGGPALTAAGEPSAAPPPSLATAAPAAPAESLPGVVLAPPTESAAPPAPSALAPAPAKPPASANPLARPVGPAKPSLAVKPVCSAVPYLDAEGNTHFRQVCN
jgi:tRNA A-37 threonylcarbamoyl transferase component Bud32